MAEHVTVGVPVFRGWDFVAQTLSTIAFIGGGVLLAAGVVMILVAPSSSSSSSSAARAFARPGVITW